MRCKVFFSALDSIDGLHGAALAGVVLVLSMSCLVWLRPAAARWCGWLSVALSSGILGGTIGTAAVSELVDSQPQSWPTALVPWMSSVAMLWAAVELGRAAPRGGRRVVGMMLVWGALIVTISCAWPRLWRTLGRPLTSKEIAMLTDLDVTGALPDHGICLWNGTPVVYRDERPSHCVLRGDAVLAITDPSGTLPTIRHRFTGLHSRCRQYWPQPPPAGHLRYVLTAQMLLSGSAAVVQRFEWEWSSELPRPALIVVQCFDPDPRVLMSAPRSSAPRRPYAILNLHPGDAAAPVRAAEQSTAHRDPATMGRRPARGLRLWAEQRLGAGRLCLAARPR